MSLALLTLGFLCVRPAQAQSGYPGGGSGGGYPGGGYPGGGGSTTPGHYWEISYANTNTVNNHFERDKPTMGQMTPTQSSGGSTIINGDEEATVTATLTWVPDASKDMTTDPPPDKDHKVHIIESGRAWQQSLGSGPGTGTADDGLGDSAASDGGHTSQGVHLIQRDGSSGTITLDPVTLKAINPVSTWQSGYPGGGSGGGYPGGGGYGYWDWTGGEGSISFFVAVDPDVNPRSVTITSSIDPTYHKDPKTGKQANVAASDGTMTADSVNLWTQSPGPAITYYAHPTGSWDPNSSYHWYSKVMETSDAGTFAPPPFPVQYPGFVSTQEHINLHCIDANDGASATANYYVNWHDEIEDWITIVDKRQDGTLVRVTPIYHPISEGKMSLETENKITVSQKATGEGSLGSDKVGVKFGVELGVDFENSTKLSTEYSFIVGKANWVERRPFWEHREGTVDNYDTHGYAGLLNWTLDSAYHPGTPLIDFDEFPRAEVSDPTY